MGRTAQAVRAGQSVWRLWCGVEGRRIQGVGCWVALARGDQAR